MQKEEFALNLQAAVQSTLSLTRQLCWNRISDTVDFVIQPDNLNDEASHLNPFELERFQARKREIGQRLTAAEVVERLWVEQKVPAYINVSVYHASFKNSTLELFIDRRLRQDISDIYHEREGYPPFHVAVPTPPYVSLESRKTRFHSNWQQWPWRIELVLWRTWWKWLYRKKNFV